LVAQKKTLNSEKLPFKIEQFFIIVKTNGFTYTAIGNCLQEIGFPATIRTNYQTALRLEIKLILAIAAEILKFNFSQVQIFYERKGISRKVIS